MQRRARGVVGTDRHESNVVGPFNMRDVDACMMRCLPVLNGRVVGESGRGNEGTFSTTSI